MVPVWNRRDGFKVILLVLVLGTPTIEHAPLTRSVASWSAGQVIQTVAIIMVLYCKSWSRGTLTKEGGLDTFATRYQGRTRKKYTCT